MVAFLTLTPSNFRFNPNSIHAAQCELLLIVTTLHKQVCHAPYRGDSNIGANDGIRLGLSFKGQLLKCQIKVILRSNIGRIHLSSFAFFRDFLCP